MDMNNLNGLNELPLTLDLGNSIIRLTDDEFHYLVNYLKSNYGIDLHRKRILLEGRLGNYLVENGFKNYTEYIRALSSDTTGKELTNLLNRVTTNHTFFMREADHFDFFKNTILPALERTVLDRDLRIWCAACSTGEESYTLAMHLLDYFSNKPVQWDKRLLATDLSLKVLDTAVKGIYTTQAIANLPVQWQRSYFSKLNDDQVEIIPEVKNEVVYRQFNLMDPIRAKKPYQVIFCRNVMIYFDLPTKLQLVERLYQALSPGGYLIIGHTESLPKPTPFEYIMPSIYRKAFQHV